MELKRVASLVDLVVAAIVIFVIWLPPREVKAKRAAGGDDEARLALGFAQARAQVRPDDAVRVADYSRRLAQVGLEDWAVQEAATAAARLSTSPERWRVLLATAVAHADRLEANEALEWAGKALTVCDGLVEQCEREGACGPGGKPWCPREDQARIDQYYRHLDAGVKSGFDPRREPEKFRQAGAAALRHVRTGAGSAPSP